MFEQISLISAGEYMSTGEEETRKLDAVCIESAETEDGETLDDYEAFLKKFEVKKTTDDCYTPRLVYDAVAGFVSEEYGVRREQMSRPFFPSGDYKREDYAGMVVVDNPPFSIISEICRFYNAHNVKFFLFAPALTLFSRAQNETCCAIPCGVTITYDNGAVVNTSFLTNLESPDVKVKTSPKLYRAVNEANRRNVKQFPKSIPKYEYPDELITATMGNYLSKWGHAVTIRKGDCIHVSELDAQKRTHNAIFGGGYLLSEPATKEKAEAMARAKEAAENSCKRVWELSRRERDMLSALGGDAME